MKGMVNHAALHNRAAPGANTDILTTAITPKEGGAWNITVCLSTSSVFNITVTDGTNSHTQALNGATALDANEAYTFTYGCMPAETNSGSANTLQYNFQVATDSVIETLIVHEAQLGAP